MYILIYFRQVRFVSLSQPYRHDEDGGLSTYIPAVDIFCEFQGTDTPCLQPQISLKSQSHAPPCGDRGQSRVGRTEGTAVSKCMH